MDEDVLSEELRVTTGEDFWRIPGIPSLGLGPTVTSDGPHGLRRQRSETDHVGIHQSDQATCFPTAAAMASSWSRSTSEAVGRALGAEARAAGVGVLLGPGLNIKRSPLGGRNFEYFSEDPILTGELGVAYVNGVQSQGVASCPKHFAANNQETGRLTRSSDVDERTLREIYLRAFGTVVRKAQPWALMSSYNPVNGVPASENSFLLSQVLRDEWGFTGVVISDWGAVADKVNALQSGLDLQMPYDGGTGERAVRDALECGHTNWAVVARAARRVATLKRRVAAVGDTEFDADEHHRIARAAAEKCVVLLKNDDVDGAPLLPLAAARVAVVGAFAEAPRYQGAGSSRVNPTKLPNALDALRETFPGRIPFFPGFNAERSAEGDAHRLADDAVAGARDADVVVLFCGLGEDDESEGYDRTSLELPSEQMRLARRILDVNPNMVLVLSNGAPVTLGSLVHQVPAIIEAWLLGQAGGEVLADILCGLVNPSGKLPETLPIKLEDVPSYLHFPGDRTGVRYGEGIFVGYRGFDALGKEVMFPFGHGLSYTSFEYRDCEVLSCDGGFRVSVTITNTGPVEGREVVQLYVGAPSSEVVRPLRELKCFEEVTLAPGCRARVEMWLDPEMLSYWDTQRGGWVIEEGTYRLYLGSSSRDIRLQKELKVEGHEPPPIDRMTTLREVFSDPFCREILLPMINAAVGGAASDELGVDVLRLLGDVPLWFLCNMAGRGEETEKLVRLMNDRSHAGDASYPPAPSQGRQDGVDGGRR